MAKTATAKAKRKQIAAYMESHFSDEEFEVLEDLLEEEDPRIVLRTKSRIVTIACDDSGQVQENFRISEGADEENYSKRKKAYIALNTSILMDYPKSNVVKDSFENSFIYLDDKEKTVSLEYDFENGKVIKEEKPKKTRATKGTNTGIEGQMSLLDFNLETEDIRNDTKDRAATPSVSKKETPKEKVFIRPKEDAKSYATFDEGTVLKSIYTGKLYTVIADFGNILKIKDKDNNSFQVPRSDYVINEEAGD